MNKLQIASLAGALSLGLLANPVPAPVAAVPAAVPSPVANVPAPVPAPVAAVPAPVAVVPAPVTVSVSASAVPAAVANVPAVEEAEKGALCKVYNIPQPRRTHDAQGGYIGAALATIEKGAVAADWGYDAKATRFDAADIAKHPFTVAKWEGVLKMTRAATLVVNVSGGMPYCVTINGQSVMGDALGRHMVQRTMSVPVTKGFNRVSIVRAWWRCSLYNAGTENFTIDFRDAASIEPARPLQPSMLKHLVGDDEGGVKNDLIEE